MRLPYPKSVYIILFLVWIALPLFGFSKDWNLPASLEVRSSNELQITSLVVTPAAVYQGEEITFSSTYQNIGNLVVDFDAKIFIYNSGEALVEILNYSTSTIVGGETQTLSLKWRTQGRPPGTYIAYANATYGAATTLTMSANFTINIQQSPSSGGGGGGGGGGGSGQTSTQNTGQNIIAPTYSSAPTISIPNLSLSADAIRIVYVTPYAEAVQGESGIISPIIENTVEKLVKFTLSLAGPEGYLFSDSAEVILAPLEKKSFPLGFRIPGSMPSGYYSLKVNITTDDSSIVYPFVLRVLPIYKTDQPNVKRTISFDYEKNEALIGITVNNPSNNPIHYLQVVEFLPDFVAGRTITYVTEPNKINYDSFGRVKSIRYDFQNIQPYESRTVTYRLPLAPSEFSSYQEWVAPQTINIFRASNGDIILRDIQGPHLLAGEKGEIAVSMFNAGSTPRDIEVDILGPAGWKITPQSFTFTIPSRNTETLVFSVESPEFAVPGTYGFTLRIKHDQQIFDKEVYVSIYNPITEIFAPSKYQNQIFDLVVGNPSDLVLPAALTVIGIGASVLLIRVWNAPRYNKSRFDELRNIGRTLDNFGKDKKV